MEKSLYIQITSFMKDTETRTAWMQGMKQFSDQLGRFMHLIEVFKTKAKKLWSQEGAWDRKALTDLHNTL